MKRWGCGVCLGFEQCSCQWLHWGGKFKTLCLSENVLFLLSILHTTFRGSSKCYYRSLHWNAWVMLWGASLLVLGSRTALGLVMVICCWLFVCGVGFFCGLFGFVWFFFQWYEYLSPYLHHQQGTALLKLDRLSSRGEKEKKPSKFKITKKKPNNTLSKTNNKTTPQQPPKEAKGTPLLFADFLPFIYPMRADQNCSQFWNFTLFLMPAIKQCFKKLFR